MTGVPFRPPELDHGPTRPYWDGFEASEIRLPQCEDCDAYHWHPRPRCPECGSADVAWVTVSGRATVYTWVEVRRDFRLPYLAGEPPYYTGLVVPVEAAPDGVRLAAILDPADSEAPEIGAELTATFPDEATPPAPVYR